MSQQQPSNEAAHPGPLASFFIHLAGADPAVFHRLPPTETTTYVKMGITVLVPFFLAFTAGTFTVHSYLTDKDKTMAVIVGVIWALFILFIDIAVMSQITPAPPPMAPEPQGPIYGPLSRQRRAPGPQPLPRRKMWMPVMRVMVAVTVGILTSHCMVLALFDESIHKAISKDLLPARNEVQVAYQKKIDPLDRTLKEADGIKSTEDSALFRAKYVDWLKTHDKSASDVEAAAKKEPPVKAAAPVTKPSKMLQDQIDAKFLKHERALASLDGEIAGKKASLEDFEADFTQAKRKLAIEKTSTTKQTYAFKHPFFKPLDGTTSGVPSDGSAGKGVINQRESVIQGIIERAPAEKTALEMDIKEKQDTRAALIESYKTEMNLLRPQLSTLLTEEAEQARAVAAQIIATQNALEIKNREAINAEVDRLSRQLTDLREQEAKDLAEYSQSPDLATRTNALHKMILGEGSETSSMRLIVLVVILTFAMLDLMPVLLKLAKSHSLYDKLMAELASQNFTFFPEQNNGWGRGVNEPTPRPPTTSDSGQRPRPPRSPLPPPPR